MQNYAIEYWEELGAPKEKLLLGIPFYGGTYTLTSPHQTQVGASSSGPGLAGEYTEEPGFLAYYEVCKGILMNNWDVSEDDRGNFYVVHGDQWIGIDTKTSIAAKVRLE